MLSNTCNQSLTYQINGPNVTFLGSGDLHDTTYDYLEHSAEYDVLDDACIYTFSIYPSAQIQESYQTGKSIYYTAAIVCVFLLTSAVFVLYDCFVSKRQNTVMTSAQQSNAIVSSLFPAQFRDRLMEDQGLVASQINEKDSKNKKLADDAISSAQGLGGGLLNTSQQSNTLGLQRGTNTLNIGTRPIADLFLECTVMFGDISGFTAWSSTREPSQVFTLLEQIYSSFDSIAKRRKIFKVETIGDCYGMCFGFGCKWTAFD